VLPVGLHELHGLDGLLAVQDDLLARLIDLRPPEAPHERLGPRGSVAEGVSEGLADRLAFLLELHADLAQLVERLGPRALSALVEPRLAIGELQTPAAVGAVEP